MTFLGRKVILTTLDPIPRSFRAVPRVLAINYKELEALQKGDGHTFKMLSEIVAAEDSAEARRIYTYKEFRNKK